MVSGQISAVSPTMTVMLKMFDPTTLPTVMSTRPWAAAVAQTASSGTDVPAATTVRPMAAGVSRARVASPTAPRSSASPPATNRSRPSRISPTLNSMDGSDGRRVERTAARW
jgi:hypothetical protein